MNIQEIFDIKQKSKGANSQYSPWNNFEGEMIKKTVIKRASKTWPYKTNLNRIQAAINILNEHEGIDFSQKYSNEQYDHFKSLLNNPLGYFIYLEEIEQDTYLSMHQKYLGGIERGYKGKERDRLNNLLNEGREIAQDIITALLSEDTREETLAELTQEETTYFKTQGNQT
jgi:hypothetical protein